LSKSEAQKVHHYKPGDYDEFLKGLQNPELVKKSTKESEKASETSEKVANNTEVKNSAKPEPVKEAVKEASHS